MSFLLFKAPTKPSRTIKFYILLFLCAALAVLVVGYTVLSTRELSRTYRAASVDMIDQRMNSIIYEINNFPRWAGNDMIFLSNLSHLENVIETSGAERESHVKYLQNDFLAFLRENTAYYKLAYIDERGKPVVTVVSDGKDYVIVDNNHSDWFQKTNSLERGEVFISKLDLNKEGDQYIPILKYGTPVFSGDGTKKGIVVSFVYADYFLDDIRAFGREGETVFLINSQGNYLAHPDRSREFAYLFGRDDSFQKDYPEAAERILSNLDKRVVETDTHIFSFRAIYPTKGSFAIFKGAEKLEKNSVEDYFWVLVSVTEKKYLQNSTRDLVSGAVLFAALSIGTLLGIVVIGYILAFRDKKKKAYHDEKP